jgi:hypothetical protein
MASASATLRRGMLSIAAAVGAGTLLAVVRSPSIDDPDQEASYGGGDEGNRLDPYEATGEPDSEHRIDPYERYGAP